MLKKRREKDNIVPAAETPKAPESTPEPVRSSGLATLVRSAESAMGGPTTAEVHPDQVAEWILAGWTIKT